jgi:hypothetical protein
MTSSTIPAAAQVHPGTKTCARAIAAVRFSAAQALEPRSSVWPSSAHGASRLRIQRGVIHAWAPGFPGGWAFSVVYLGLGIGLAFRLLFVGFRVCLILVRVPAPE